MIVPSLKNVIFGKTALYELYIEDTIDPVFSKIIMIGDDGLPVVEITDKEYEEIPNRVYLQAITIRKEDGNIRTFYPHDNVKIGEKYAS